MLLAADTGMAIAPWHNQINPRDVNHDNRISAMDALYVVNDLLRNGPRDVPTQVATPLVAGAGSATMPYLDVTGDNRVTPTDALIVINKLLATPLLDVHTTITDLSGNPISTIDAGQDFLIEIDVQDIRNPASATPGVFSAFVNLAYDSGLIEIPQQTPDPGPDFAIAQGQQLDLTLPGFVPGFLLISGLTPRPNNNVQQLFTIVAHANAAGVALFAPSFDATPGHDMLLYPDVFLTEPDIQFVGSSLTVVESSALSVSDKSLIEGDSGQSLAVFTVSLSTAAAGPVTVRFETVDGTATTADNDYGATSGTLTFQPGELAKLVTVLVNGDTNIESDETFSLVLSNANVQIVDDTALGAIINDDFPPTLSLSQVSILEGNAGTTDFVFTAALSTAASQNVVVVYGTADGTATTGNNDYVAQSGTLTFAPGQTNRTITIAVKGDTAVEDSETFTVNLTPTSGPPSVLATSATGTIINDDGTPILTISDATVVGPSSGVVFAAFTVTLSAASGEEVSVGYATADNTAVANEDYTPLSDTLTFEPNGSLTKTILVPIIARPPGSDTTFFVNLSSSSPNAVVGDAQGVGTIIRSGFIAPPLVADVEGNSGTTARIFTVSLSGPLDHEATVAYSTADGTGTVANNDYQPQSGVLTFAAGVTSQTVTVNVVGDTTVEGNETFFLNLSNPVGTAVLASQSTGLILNDDGQQAAIRLQLVDQNGDILPMGSHLEVGDKFKLQVYVQDIQQEPFGIFEAITDIFYDQLLVQVDGGFGNIVAGPGFTIVTGGDTATPGLVNEVGAIGGVTPPADPGQEQLLLTIPFEAVDFGLASFTLDAAETADAVLSYSGVIPNSAINFVNTSVNIGSNVFVVDDVSAAEGNSGDTPFVFTVTRLLPTENLATVVYSTISETATAGSDYVAQSGTLTFAQGETTKQVTIAVKGDLTDEPNETFQLKLSNASSGATATEKPGVGTIIDDDEAPSMVISDAAGIEGEALEFTVSLSAISGKTVTVAYSTADALGGNPATAGSDYQPTAGVITFAPGVLQQTITVDTFNDIFTEPAETFRLVLASPTNATLGADAEGQGTIADVPPATISGHVYVDLNNNGLKDGNESGIGNVSVIATLNDGTFSRATLTNADGSFSLVGLLPGTYSLTEIQPGFFSDGRDTRFGVESAVNDTFTGIVLSPSETESGYSFGERGVRAEFISAFINRRAFFASAIVTGEWGGQIGTVGAINPKAGDVWISFDAGWIGQRTVDAFYAANQGAVTMRLYNNNLQEVATSFNVDSSHAQLIYNGNSTSPLFLKVSGANDQVSISVTPPVQSAVFQAAVASSTTSGANFRSGTLTSAAPSAAPQASPDADDLVWSEDEDWLH